MTTTQQDLAATAARYMATLAAASQQIDADIEDYSRRLNAWYANPDTAEDHYGTLYAEWSRLKSRNAEIGRETAFILRSLKTTTSETRQEPRP